MSRIQLEYFAGTDELLTITTSEIDFTDGTGTKTPTATIETATDPTTTLLVLTGLTVTQVGTPSIVTIQPNAGIKALGAGIYSLVLNSLDSGGLTEKTNPWGTLIVKG